MPQVMHKKDARDVARNLNRVDCEEILTDHGFAVYDWESLSVLQDAIEVNLIDGTIPLQSVFVEEELQHAFS